MPRVDCPEQHLPLDCSKQSVRDSFLNGGVSVADDRQASVPTARSGMSVDVSDFGCDRCGSLSCGRRNAVHGLVVLGAKGVGKSGQYFFASPKFMLCDVRLEHFLFGLACTVTLGRAKQVPDKAVTPPFVFCEGRASLCAIQDLDDLALFLSSSGFMLG